MLEGSKLDKFAKQFCIALFVYLSASVLARCEKGIVEEGAVEEEDEDEEDEKEEEEEEGRRRRRTRRRRRK